MANGFKNSLYYQQLASQGSWDWLYSRPQEVMPIMMNPNYNNQAIYDYNWNNGISQGEQVQEYRNAIAPQQPVAPQQMQRQGVPYSQPSVPVGSAGMVPTSLPDQGSYPPVKGAVDYMGIASAGINAIGDTIQMFKAPKYDTSVQGGDWSGYNPRHGLGDELARIKGIGEASKGTIGREVGSGALKFGSTGAQIGTAILPGIGTAIGAVGGALVGAIGGFFGGRHKKKKMAKQQDKIMAGVRAEAKEFSDVNIQAKQEQQARRIALQNLA